MAAILLDALRGAKAASDKAKQKIQI